jgi:hypothetical protein
MEWQAPDYECLSNLAVASMEEELRLHESNMRNVSSHLLGGLLLYEGDCMSLMISELMIKNNDLKTKYRVLVNGVNAELGKHRVPVRAFVGTSEEELFAPNDEIRRINAVKVYDVVHIAVYPILNERLFTISFNAIHRIVRDKL